MNYTIIVLGVLLLIVIYFLYTVLATRGQVISTQTNLNASNSLISYSTLTNPSSSRFSFGVWVYAETLKSTGNTDIFKVEDATGRTFFDLFVDEYPTLNYSILTSSGIHTNQFMTNFPLQKWVYLIVSVDNTVVDLYLDGKLIRSQQLDTGPITTDNSFNVRYGVCGSECRVYLTNFERISNPMDPSTAWNKYMKGNGHGYLSNLSSYSASVSISKDNVGMSSFTLF